MRVVLIGAGALGQIFAFHLLRSGAEVLALCRPSREANAPEEWRITLARKPAETFVMRRGRSTEPFDFTVLAVRADQIDDELLAMLEPLSSVPLVALTPLLPRAYARVNAVVPTLLAAMPSVAVELDEQGRLRYWCPPLGPSLIEGSFTEGVAAPLLRALRAGGLPARAGKGVATCNWATTITFFSFQLAVCCAGGFLAWLEDAALFRLSLQAAHECRRVAARVGRADPAIVLFVHMAPGLRWARRLLGRFLPTACAYVDHHFGAKLAGQHRTLIAEIRTLGVEHGADLHAFEALSARLAVASLPG